MGKAEAITDKKEMSLAVIVLKYINTLSLTRGWGYCENKGENGDVIEKAFNREGSKRVHRPGT